MLQDVTPFLVHEALIEDHRADNLRSGEGCMETLRDGSLLMIYGKFVGGSDYDKATLVQRKSTDGGITWSEPEVFLETPADAMNVMSASMLRLADGRLMVCYLLKRSKDDCRPWVMFTEDEGRTWSQPILTIDTPAYYVVNNDRLVQLASGRILIPYQHYFHDVAKNPGYCACALSDDGGRTWRQSQGIHILPENLIEPLHADPASKSYQAVFVKHELANQEPGVIELADGGVMMWCRSNTGYAWRAWSSDQGDTWSPFEPITEFAQPCGPQSIKRPPGSQRLVMICNDRGSLPLGHDQFNWRRPLMSAVSDDQGRSWHRLGLLEPDTVPSTCYYSIHFHEGNALFTYYLGNMTTRDTGLLAPVNLRSLKLRIIRQAFFNQPV